MKVFFLCICGLLGTAVTQAALLDALLAKVGREPVLASDLERFREVNAVLACANLREQRKIPKETRALLDAYVEEELMYQEAQVKKMSTIGIISDTVHAIHRKPECKDRWLVLGRKYTKLWRKDNRPREGESMLVRELEKRVLVEKFRKTELVGDVDLWVKEAKARFPVKLYLE